MYIQRLMASYIKARVAATKKVFAGDSYFTCQRTCIRLTVLKKNIEKIIVSTTDTEIHKVESVACRCNYEVQYIKIEATIQKSLYHAATYIRGTKSQRLLHTS